MPTQQGCLCRLFPWPARNTIQETTHPTIPLCCLWGNHALESRRLLGSLVVGLLNIPATCKVYLRDESVLISVRVTTLIYKSLIIPSHQKYIDTGQTSLDTDPIMTATWLGNQLNTYYEEKLVRPDKRKAGSDPLYVALQEDPTPLHHRSGGLRGIDSQPWPCQASTLSPPPHPTAHERTNRCFVCLFVF